MWEKAVYIQEPQFPYRKEQGRSIYGYDQEWYPTEWQRRAGCGPTTSAFISDYIFHRDGWLDKKERESKQACLASMERLWTYVTPSKGGVYKTQWLYEGLQQYMQDCRPNQYEVKKLSIYPFHIARPSVAVVASFIQESIKEDSPLAFLNRHDGGEKELYTWHWVPLVGIQKEGESYICTCYDEQQIRHFSLNRWLRQTSLGGGFVAVHKK